MAEKARKHTYTRENAYAAISGYVQKYGHAPDHNSGKILHGELAKLNKTFQQLYQAFYKGNVRDVPPKQKMPDFITAHQFPIKSPLVYNRANVLKTLQLYQDEFGCCPSSRDESIIEKGPLANGKRTYRNLVMAFTRNQVDDVPSGTSYSDFVKNENLTEFAIYTLKKVIKTLLLFSEKNDGLAPLFSNGIIQDGPLANGKRTFRDLFYAFNKNKIVVGAENHETVDQLSLELGLTLQTTFTRENALEALRLHAQHYRKPATQHSEETMGGTLGQLGKNYKSLYQAFYRNHVQGVPEGTTMGIFMSAYKNITMFSGNAAPPKKIDLPAVFNSVAWQIIKLEEEKEMIREAGEQLHTRPVISLDLSDEQQLSRYAHHSVQYGALSHPSLKMTWDKLTQMAHQGEIEGLDSTFNLTKFAIEIHERILSQNYSCPSTQEVKAWMRAP